jgi:hypothetical protein
MVNLNEKEILEKAHIYQKRVVALHSVPVNERAVWICLTSIGRMN